MLLDLEKEFRLNLNMLHNKSKRVHPSKTKSYHPQVQLMWKTRDLCFFICLFIKSPIWNPNIKLLRQSRTCSAHDQVDAYRLVVVYKSGVFNFDERAQLRDNYANLPSDVRVVFVTGQPASSRSARQASSFQMNGGYKLVLRQRTAAKRRNEKWATRSREARERLLDEADEHGDLVVGDFVDTYVNLTYKMLTSHRWASAFCQGKQSIITHHWLIALANLTGSLWAFACLLIPAKATLNVSSLTLFQFIKQLVAQFASLNSLKME